MEGDSQPIDSFQDTLTKNVFGNVVLWDVIGGYLGPGELKDCRLVCKTFDKMVRDCRRWKEGDMWQLHLNEDNWSDPGLSALQVAISNVKVTLSGTGPEETEALDKLSNIFKDIKSLAVDFKEEAETKPEFDKLGALTTATMAVIFGHCSSNLTTLILQKEVLSCTKNSTVFNSPKTLQMIKGLKTFIVNETSTQSLLEEVLLEEENFLRLLAFNLNNVEVLRLKTQGNTDFSPFPPRHLKTLLERRAPALKELELGEIDLLLMISPEGLSHLHFPQLSHLSLRVRRKSIAQLCEFLSRHPPLHSLTIKVRGLLTKSLVDVIAEKSDNLGSLELKFWMVEEGLQWEWLSRCSKLTSFSLTNPTFFRALGNMLHVRVEIEDILLSLPNGMKKIAFRSSGCNAPLTTNSQLREVLQDSKFSKLEEVSILFLPGASLYNALEVLGSKTRFPKLRKLHLSHICHNGELGGEKAFWQGLEDVCLRSVSGIISEQSLMEKFGGSKNLRKLTLRNISVMEILATAALDRLVKSSKSLETLVINKGSSIGDDLPHRVKSVRYCPRVPFARNEDVDSDSDVGYYDSDD